MNKCPICNTENPPEAKSCEQCGFSLGLTQPTWPEFPTIEVPTIAPQWPDLPTGPVDNESSAPSPQESPPPALTDDDELARWHIQRGFEAVRQDLPDQAVWEFEQARDLADSDDVASLAQAQLDGLSEAAPQSEQEQSPTETLPATIPDWLAEFAPQSEQEQAPTETSPAAIPDWLAEFAPQPQPGEAPAETSPAKPPDGLVEIADSPTTRPPTARPIRSVNWRPAVRIGLTVGAVNGLLSGCGAVFCLGLLLAPACGFIAGWLTARNKAVRRDRIPDLLQALLASGIAGVGGWIGQTIGYPAWLASLESQQSNSSLWLFVTCVSGALYILISIGLGVVGWRTGAPKRKVNP